MNQHWTMKELEGRQTQSLEVKKRRAVDEIKKR